MKKIEKDGTLSAMREYIERNKMVKQRQSRTSIVEPVIPESSSVAGPSALLRPPVRDQKYASSSRKQDFIDDAWAHPEVPLSGSFGSSGRRRIGPATSFDGFARTPLPQDVNDAVSERAKLREWTDRYGPSSGLPVHVWATALAKEVDTVVPPDAPRPNGLRAAVAMHVAKAAFRALHVPDGIWTDLVTAVYAANSSEDSRLAELADEGWLNRVFSFQAMEQCKDFAEEMRKETTAARTAWKEAEEHVKRKDELERQMMLTLHFNAWRSLKRHSAWKWCALAVKEHSIGTKWVRRCFDAWRVCVKLSKTEAEVEELSSALENVKRDTSAELQRTIEDKDLRTFNERLRFEAELKEARRRQVTDEELAANHRMKEHTKELEEAVEELKGVRQGLELQVKDAGIFKEQSLEALNDAVLQVRKTFHSALAGRALEGLKASDLVVNAERASRGEMTEFRTTNKEGSDIVNLPLQCRAEHLLLAFTNYVVEAVTSSFPRITCIGPPMADGALYASMVQYVFPNRPQFASKMTAESDGTRRVEYFLSELDLILVTAGQVEPSNSLRLGRYSPLQSAGITTADVLAGAADAHCVILAYLLLCYTRHRTINVVANLKYGEFIMQEEERQTKEPIIKDLATAHKVLDELSVALYLVNRSISSWRLVTQHVEDQLLSSLSSMRRAIASDLVLRAAEDSRLIHFLIPDVDTTASMAVTEAASANPVDLVEQSLEATSPVALTSSRTIDADSVEYLAARAIEDMIPHSHARNNTLRSVAKHIVLIANIFSHYARHKMTMNILEFNTLCGDMQVSQFLQQGETIDTLFNRHARYDRSKGVFGVEFVTLLVDLSHLVVPKVPLISEQEDTLESFLAHFILFRDQNPLHFTAVAEAMQQDRTLSVELNTRRKFLKVLFVGIVTHFANAPGQNATTAPTAKKKGQASSAVQALPPPPVNPTGNASAPTLSFADFIKFCNDLELIDASVPPKEVQLILDSAKRRLEPRDAPPPAMTEMSFTEALCALCMYHFPSPFVTLGARFRCFINDMVVPKLKVRMPAVAANSLAQQ